MNAPISLAAGCVVWALTACNDSNPTGPSATVIATGVSVPAEEVCARVGGILVGLYAADQLLGQDTTLSEGLFTLTYHGSDLDASVRTLRVVHEDGGTFGEQLATLQVDMAGERRAKTPDLRIRALTGGPLDADEAVADIASVFEIQALRAASGRLSGEVAGERVRTQTRDLLLRVENLGQPGAEVGAILAKSRAAVSPQFRAAAVLEHADPVRIEADPQIRAYQHDPAGAWDSRVRELLDAGSKLDARTEGWMQRRAQVDAKALSRWFSSESLERARAGVGSDPTKSVQVLERLLEGRVVPLPEGGFDRLDATTPRRVERPRD